MAPTSVTVGKSDQLSPALSRPIHHPPQLIITLSTTSNQMKYMALALCLLFAIHVLLGEFSLLNDALNKRYQAILELSNILPSNSPSRRMTTHHLKEHILAESSTLKDFDRIRESPKHLKLTFVVGLEGSGHHLTAALFWKMTQQSRNLRLEYNATPSESGVVIVGMTLKFCLQLCFDTTHWGKNISEAHKTEFDKKGWDKWKEIDDFCDCAVDELKRYANTLPNGSLLAFGWPYSYPFGRMKIEKFPDLELLISMAQSPKLAPYIFDVRLIVMKRDVATCLVSSCIHRFGHCDARIKYAERGLSLIHTQLMGIDPQFWIMLDYDHLVTHLNDSRYVDIIAKWLSVDPMFVDDAFKNIEPSNTTLLQSQWDELKNYSTSKDYTDIIKRLFYGRATRKWPIFSNPYFTVTPHNTAFLNSKVTSHQQDEPKPDMNKGIIQILYQHPHG